MNIVIYPGSFNPIHNGHIALAKAALALPHIDEVWIMVTPCNPWKQNRSLWDDTHRLNMVKRAFEGVNGILASDFEFSLPRPSYTIYTLTALKSRYPSYSFQLLVGEDNFNQFNLWKDGDRIIKEFGLIVYPRDSKNTTLLPQDHVTLLELPLWNVSSSLIRQKIRKREPIIQYVPKNVFEYIEKYKLGE